MAEIYSGLGTEVTLLEMMDQILPGEDAELARRLEAALKRKGIGIRTGTRVEGIGVSGAAVRVVVEEGEDLEAERVLIGIGRRPVVSDLGLEEAGVSVEGGAIAVDGGMRTSAPGVFAVGDVTGKYLLAHVAQAQGLIAGENATGGEAEMNYGAVPRCVYTDPEFSAVGMGEAEAASAGLDSKVTRVRLGQVGRALTMGETMGMAKVVWEAGTGKVLGYHVLGPHSSEMLPEVSLAIGRGLNVREVADVIHPHPTLSELLWEAMEQAARSM
jgi:dihydrolipoamide dehydrogenase